LKHAINLLRYFPEKLAGTIKLNYSGTHSFLKLEVDQVPPLLLPTSAINSMAFESQQYSD